MKKMTTEEKLARCIEFIEKIESMQMPYEDGPDGYRVVPAECVDELKDSAWHMLADLT